MCSTIQTKKNHPPFLIPMQTMPINPHYNRWQMLAIDSVKDNNFRKKEENRDIEKAKQTNKHI